MIRNILAPKPAHFMTTLGPLSEMINITEIAEKTVIQVDASKRGDVG